MLAEWKCPGSLLFEAKLLHSLQYFKQVTITIWTRVETKMPFLIFAKYEISRHFVFAEIYILVKLSVSWHRPTFLFSRKSPYSFGLCEQNSNFCKNSKDFEAVANLFLSSIYYHESFRNKIACHQNIFTNFPFFTFWFQILSFLKRHFGKSQYLLNFLKKITEKTKFFDSILVRTF